MSRPPKAKRIVHTFGPGTRLIGYIRVSTKDQAKLGSSLAAQVDRMHQWCAQRGCTLVGEMERDVESGSSFTREALERALKRMRNGEAEGILVNRLDRFTRDLHHLTGLMKTDFGPDGCYLLRSVNEDLDPRTSPEFTEIRGVFNQMERRRISERTKEVLGFLKRQNVWIGGTPYGQTRLERPDVYTRAPLIDNEAQRQVIARIRALRASGLSMNKIAATLQSEGQPTQRGGKWGSETVRKILYRLNAQTAVSTTA